jgi:hypothetical protein
MATKKRAGRKKPAEVEIPQRILDQLVGSRRTFRNWLAELTPKRRELVRAIIKRCLERKAAGQSFVGWKTVKKIFRQEFEKDGFDFADNVIRDYARSEWPDLYDDASSS